MVDRTEVVIIGGGLIGCAAALELARRGRRVTVVERLPAVGLGSTSKSTAIIRQLYHERHSILLAIEGLRLWESWRDYLGHDVDLARFHQAGILWVLRAADLAGQPVETLRSLGAEVELLDAAALAARFPDFRFDDTTDAGPPAGLLETRAGFVDRPTRAVENLALAAARAGVVFRTGETVTGFDHDDSALPAGGRRRIAAVRLASGGRIEAPVMINASGPHSAGINALAGAPLPLLTAPNRQQFFEGPETALPWGERPPTALPVCADTIGGLYFRPDRERFRVGTVMADGDRHFVPDADAPLAPPARDFIADKSARLARRLPGARIEAPTGVSALYDVTLADWCPILDKTDIDGWFVAIGTSGKWFKAGPVIGGLVAELVEWVAAGHDPDRPADRLEIRLPRSGHTLPMADFARWRVPHQTGGVLA